MSYGEGFFDGDADFEQAELEATGREASRRHKRSLALQRREDLKPLHGASRTSTAALTLHLEQMTDAELFAHLEHCDGPRLRAYCRLLVLRVSEVRETEAEKDMARRQHEVANFARLGGAS